MPLSSSGGEAADGGSGGASAAAAVAAIAADRPLALSRPSSLLSSPSRAMPSDQQPGTQRSSAVSSHNRATTTTATRSSTTNSSLSSNSNTQHHHRSSSSSNNPNNSHDTHNGASSSFIPAPPSAAPPPTAHPSVLASPPSTPSRRSNSHTHARASVGSAASTLDSYSELTSPSSSSRDSIQKLPRTPRRPKHQHQQQQPQQHHNNNHSTNLHHHPTNHSSNSNSSHSNKSQARWNSKSAPSSDATSSPQPRSSKSASSPAAGAVPPLGPTQHSPRPNWPPNHRPHSHTGLPANTSASAGVLKGQQLMAANFGSSSGDARRGVSSPRPKGREAKNTFCRNVTIYGHCRYENTCPYIHDPSKLNQSENVKKRFNVDSPSFTPLQPNTNGSLTPSSRSAAISPKAANAAVFTPKSQRSTTSTPSLHTKEPVTEWHPAQDFTEFVPGQGFESQLVDPTASAQALGYDPFNTSGAMSSLSGAAHQAAAINPYAQDPTGLSGTAFYQGTNTFQTSPLYHLYWPIGPQPTNLLAYQRTAHDFFISDVQREDLQKKAEVARQVLPNSSLPPIEQYHSLVCLDTSQHKNQTLFGYPSWVYKAISSKDGNTYALRRLENFRLTNESAIRSVQSWKRVLNGSVVTVHDAFTTRAFGDSSLIVVMDYHPCSKSLAEEHFKASPMTSRFHGRQPTTNHVHEQVLWGYLVQIASALKAIHAVGLAARLITPSKILLTSKNRVRLNACSILDVVHFDNTRSLAELQADDLVQLGRLILCIANNSATAHLNMQKSMEYITRSYTARLKECIQWLLNPQPNPGTPTSPTGTPAGQKDIDALLTGICDQFTSVFDSTLHASDALTNTLGRELESSRLVRLLIKLNMINERPELDASIPIPSGSTTNPSASWAETGERYYLKLFRDYVFHQVDANGHPVTNLAHVLDCLNKLDAGSEEKIALISRDEQNVLVVSYRELKRGVESAFQDLIKAGRGAGR